jgi:hypothetical protein
MIFCDRHVHEAMLPLSKLAAGTFNATHGSGARETAPSMTPRKFDQYVKSTFGDVRPSDTVRTFDMSADGVVIHTSGKRPSSQTVRVIRATTKVLTAVYGPRPHATVQVFLADNPLPKTLPRAGGPVTVTHINSGFSQGCNVVVFRCSEMHRTLVHELVHCWRTHSLDRPEQQLFAHLKLGAPKGCLLTEAFVEAVTWLVYGGYCSKGLDPAHALRTARAYLCTVDDGRTNGWAYFVGRALLVADGGKRFHDDFFKGMQGTRLMDAESHRALVRNMAASFARLGGKGLPLAPSPAKGAAEPLRLCNCSLGAPFTSKC